MLELIRQSYYFNESTQLAKLLKSSGWEYSSEAQMSFISRESTHLNMYPIW